MVPQKKQKTKTTTTKTCLGLFSFFYLKMKQEKKNTTKSRLKYLDVEKKILLTAWLQIWDGLKQFASHMLQQKQILPCHIKH